MVLSRVGSKEIMQLRNIFNFGLKQPLHRGEYAGQPANLPLQYS